LFEDELPGSCVEAATAELEDGTRRAWRALCAEKMVAGDRETAPVEALLLVIENLWAL
jgi:hypothetical protein